MQMPTLRVRLPLTYSTDRKRPPTTSSDNGLEKCDLHHIALFSIRGSGCVWCALSAGGIGRDNPHCPKRRIIDGMSKPRRRSRQKPRQARSGQPHHKAVEAAGATRRPSQQASAGEILDRLKRARSARDAAQAEVDVLVDGAVGLGIGWPEIAQELGVSRQAARQRYQRRHGSA
jgi:hypothetical protein